MNPEINIESFISFCNNLMIAEEVYRLPTDKLLPAIFKEPNTQLKLSQLVSAISNLKSYDDLDALYDLYLTSKAFAHIVNYHTNKMIKSGILAPKSEKEYKTVFFHAANNGEILFEKGDCRNINSMRRKLKRMLHIVFKQHTSEIVNFHYSDDRRLYNSHTMRYEYNIDHSFKNIIGHVQSEGSEDFIDTNTIRVVFAKVSKYDHPIVVSMFPILNE